jgi:hypothetical protein
VYLLALFPCFAKTVLDLALYMACVMYDG